MKYKQKRKREKLPRVLEVMPLHKVPENMKRDKKLKAMSEAEKYKSESFSRRAYWGYRKEWCGKIHFTQGFMSSNYT